MIGLQNRRPLHIVIHCRLPLYRGRCPEILLHVTGHCWYLHCSAIITQLKQLETQIRGEKNKNKDKNKTSKNKEK